MNVPGKEDRLEDIGDLVVLAAGMGRRFGGAKQMESAGPNGELLLEYSLYDAVRVGFESVVFVIQEDQERDFRARLPDALFRRCQVSFAPQRLDDVPSSVVVPRARTKPWGTGHAVLSARRHVNGAFAVINADDFYGVSSYARLAEFMRGPCRHDRWIGLVGFEVPKTLSEHGIVSRGICRQDEEGFLAEIVERTRVGMHETHCVYWDENGEARVIPEDARASMNMWAFPEGFMASLDREFDRFTHSPSVALGEDEFFLPTAVANRMAQAGQPVRVLPTDAEWMGLTFRRDLDRVRAALSQLISSGAYPHDLWKDGA